MNVMSTEAGIEMAATIVERNDQGRKDHDDGEEQAEAALNRQTTN